MSMSLRWRISLQCLTTMEHGGEGEGGKLTNSIAEGTRSVGRSVALSTSERIRKERGQIRPLSLSLFSVVRTLSITRANFPLAVYPHCAGGGVSDKAGGRGRAEEWFASFLSGDRPRLHRARFKLVMPSLTPES